MAHEPLPGLYYDTVTHRQGTVTLEPDFDAIMFQPQPGGRPDQFSPDIAGKRLRLVDEATNAETNGFVWFADPIDWDLKLNALRDPAPPVAKEEAPVELEPAPASPPAWLPDDWTMGKPGVYFGPHGEEVYTGADRWVVATGTIRETEDLMERDRRALVYALAHPDSVVNPPTFAGLAAFQEAGFLQEVNRLVLHPSGRALSFTSDEATGEIMDVTMWITDDPAGIAFLPDADAMPDFVAKAERVARNIAERSAARLKDPDLKGNLIEPVLGNGLRYESIAFPAHDIVDAMEADRMTVELTRMRRLAESFLLADDHLNATQRQTGAHDAAMRILGVGGKDPDPRATMRGEIARLTGEVERLKAETADLAGQARTAHTTLGQVRSTLDGFLAFDSVEISPEMADRDLAELLAKAFKTDDPSRLSPSEVANLRAMWSDPDGGQIHAVRWYRERFTPSLGLAEALRDVRVFLGLPTVSLEERVAAIQRADLDRAAIRKGNGDPMNAERRAWMRAIIANEIAHNKGQPAWCEWLLDALDRVDLAEAFGSAFVAVNDTMHPYHPSNWLRDLRACRTIKDFNALRDRAIAAMTPDQSEDE